MVDQRQPPATPPNSTKMGEDENVLMISAYYQQRWCLFPSAMSVA